MLQVEAAELQDLRRSYGHDLARLLDKSLEHDLRTRCPSLTDTHITAIRGSSDLYKNKQFEYIRIGGIQLMPIDQVAEAAKTLITGLNNFPMRTAQATLFTMVDSIKLLRDLQRQAVSIESVYAVQMQLFGTGPENVELLNRSGSIVFAYFESLADQYIILKLSAMTERQFVARRETLSVKRLRYMLCRVPDNQHLLTAEFFDEFDRLAADLGRKMCATRKFRNKHVAHLDLEQGQTREWVPLTNGQIREAMEALYKLLNHVEYAIMGGCKTEYAGMLLPSESDGNKLLGLLKLADEAIAIE